MVGIFFDGMEWSKCRMGKLVRDRFGHVFVCDDGE
jgi:hypothetical protein